jgi:hypothetical protein
MIQSSVRDKHVRVQRGFSLKLLAAFVLFVAGRELFRLYMSSSELLANLVGLGLWTIVVYVAPPRPTLWKLLLAAASLALLAMVLHLSHVG